MKKSLSIYALAFLLITTLIFSGCGKHEARSGAVGAIAGGAIGNIATGGRSKGVGTLAGAALGGLIGSCIGQDADEEVNQERMERRAKEQQLAYERSKPKVVVVHHTPKYQGSYCSTCYKNVALSGARRCPDCGDVLVYEKFCDLCHESFNPRSEYRYCPYCPQRVRLAYR